MKLDLRDVRFECFSGHGPGGQNRNKCQKCVRAIHEPTGIVGVSTSERSLRQNKANAIESLQAKLDQMKADQIQAAKAARRDEKPEASFGAQIRTTRMCGNEQGTVDHRTGARAGIDGVFRGRIDGLIQAFLRKANP
jgi:protein subunit release factor A